MESTEIYTIERSYFSDKYTMEFHLRILDLDTNEQLILNHLLFIFKMHIYNARTTGYLNINNLLTYIKGIKDTKKKLCENDGKRRKKFNKKWKSVLLN